MGTYIYTNKGRFTWGPKSPLMLASPPMEAKVPTFEPQGIKGIWLIITKVGSWLREYSWDLCWELGLVFCSTQLSAKVSSLTFKKCCHVGIHVTKGRFTWGPKSSLMLASPNMEAKVPTFEPQGMKEIWLIITKDGSWLFYGRIFSKLVLKYGFSFLLDPTLKRSPKPHLQKVLSCRHPCHICNLQIGVLYEVICPSCHALNSCNCTSSDLGLRA